MSAWPAGLRGVTETVVTTLGPNGLWNVAALGVHAPERSESANRASGDEGTANHAPERGRASPAPATARTFGRTRTRRNFERRGEGYVQFVADPLRFAEAALTVTERESPILAAAAAWTRVEVEPLDREERDGTAVVSWALRPAESATVRTSVPSTNRGHAAVIEGTVAASRLGVSGFDDAALRARLDYFASVCERCGGPRERAAFALIDDAVDEQE